MINFAFVALAARAAVVVLTDATIDQFLIEEKVTMVEFYAPWCGHCKTLAPLYDIAAETLAKLSPPLKIAKVDCTVEKKACETYDVKGFPTLKVFRNGVPSEYKGQRSAEDIVATVTKASMPVVSELTGFDFTNKSAKLEAFVKSGKVALVAFLKKDAKESKAFKAAAEKLDLLVASTDNEADAKKHNVKSPAIVLFKTFDDLKNVYEGKFDEESIIEFAKSNSVPLVDDIGAENYEKYMEGGLPIAYFFTDDASQKEKFGPALNKLAKDNKGKMFFVYIDATKFSGHALTLALKEGTWPAFAIQHKDHKWPLDQSIPLTIESITKIVSKQLSGELAPTLKSDPIPEKNEEGVKVVVGNNFKDIVLNTKNDVLLEFYAPWCGHCKSLMPVWDKLGATATEGIVIAKIDATTNDMPVGIDLQVQGFPTIVLFKAGDNAIVKHDGDRTLEGFKAFLKENAVNGAKIVIDDDEEVSAEEVEEKDEL